MVFVITLMRWVFRLYTINDNLVFKNTTFIINKYKRRIKMICRKKSYNLSKKLNKMSLS